MNYGTNDYGGYQRQTHFHDIFSKEFYRTTINNAYFLRLTEIDGRPYIGISKFFQAPDGQLRPSRSQVNIPLQAFHFLNVGLKELEAFISEYYTTKNQAPPLIYGPTEGFSSMGANATGGSLLHHGCSDGK